MPATSTTTTFQSTGTLQTFTAATAGWYDIVVYGAQGAGGSDRAQGGLGAEMGGDFYLTTGETLDIVVGQQGGASGGGGGGSFVYLPATQSSAASPLVVAGGGGGAAQNAAGGAGQAGTNGAAGASNSEGGQGGTGGTNENGGSGGGAGDTFYNAEGGGGGGGFVSAGGLGTAPSDSGSGGAAGSGTAAGGSGIDDGGAGGYGGGGGAAFATGGGGGGYSGGGGGAFRTGGGGGGLFDGSTLSNAALVEVTGGATAGGNGSVVITQTSFNVSDTASLNTAIQAIDLSGSVSTPNTAYTISLTGNITLTQQLYALNLATGDTLTIQGAGDTLDGAGTYNGLFVYAGTVSINNLSIVDAKAQGGNGGSGGDGGGGGAGLGGGLFVGAGGAVTLNSVTFQSDAAVGGTGGNPDGIGLFSAGGGLDGGSGASSTDGKPTQGGSGVSGSSGYGGGAGDQTGGFGGGGGGNSGGGFGGGGGGGGGGYGGFGGGKSNQDGAAGGGLGAGGAVFVQQGGSLTFSGGSVSGDSVSGGAGGSAAAFGPGNSGGGSGSAFGAGLFLQGNQQITLSALQGQTLSIADVIADQIGSGGTKNGSGGGLLIQGPGTVTLSAANTYYGGTTIGSGTLALLGTTAAGSGAIGFAAGSAATLLLGNGVDPANTIDGFALGDTIDLAGVGMETSATLLAGNVLLVTGTGPSGIGPSVVALQLDPKQSFAGEIFVLAGDGAGGTDVTLVNATPSTFGGVPAQPVATSDEAAAFPFRSVIVTDSNPGSAPTETLTVTPGATGTGTLLATTGGSVGSNGAFTATGTAQQVTAALQGLEFVPTAHEVAPGQTVTTQFTLSDTNSADPGAAATASVSVAATAVNDAPTITGMHATADANSAAVTPFSGVTIADPDQGVGDSLTIILSGAGGTLSGTGLSGSGSSYVLAAATPATLSSELDALSFTPGGAGTTTFTLTASQTAGGSTANKSDAGTSVSNVVASTFGGVPGSAVATSDEAAAFPFAKITVSDANTGSPTETLTVTPGATGNGTLLATTGGSVGSNGAFTATGTAQQVTAALQGLEFVPVAHEVAPDQVVTTQFTLSDTNSADPGATATASVSVAATAVNDAPTITGSHATADANNAAVPPFSGVTIADPDRGVADSLTITLSGAGGTLSGTGLSGSGSSYVLAAATPATLSSELDALSFTPGGAGTTTFTLVASQTAGGSTVTASDARTSVSNVVASTLAGVPGSAVATSDEAAAFPFRSVTVSDTNPGSPTETLTVTPGIAGNGTLLATTGGSVGSNGAFTATGTAQQVTAALQGLEFVPKAHEVAPGQVVTTQFTLSDTNSADPGATATASVSVAATAVNDAPTITGTKAGQATTDQASIAPLSHVTVSDPDVGQTETATLTLSTAANGKLSNLGAGALNSAGTVYTVSGSSAAVTTALDGLVFTPTAHEVTPGQSVTTGFSLAVSDGTATTTDATTTVVATAVNDPPVIAGTKAGQTTTDEASIAPLSHVTVSDPDVGQTETATLTLSTAANGKLSNLGAGTLNSAGTVYTVSGSSAAVTTALDGLVFTPTAHEMTPGQSVTTGFSLAVSDGTATTKDATTTVVATAVNDPPVIAGTKAGQTTTDYAAIKPFATAVVSDVDVGVQDSLVITLRTSGGTVSDANGTLSGTGLTKTGTGTYTLAATSPTTLTGELQALAFAPTQHEVAAGGTITTGFTLTASQTAGGSTTTATDATTSVTATALNYIDGPPYGLGLIIGSSGSDVITAHGSVNTIFSNGGNDIILAGQGNAVVFAAGGNDTITLGGGFNTVSGGDGNDTVTGAPGGSTSITLGNGNDVVQIGGSGDTIQLGNGNSMVSGTQGMAFITTGSGNDSIALGGSGSTVNAGAGTNTIIGGTGSDGFAIASAGKGVDLITGFTETNADVLDLRAALAATNWNHLPNTLASYLKVTASGGNTTLAIAPTGSGAGTPVAVLNGSGALGLSDLLAHHSLLTG